MKAKVLPNVNGVNCINGVDGEKWSKEYRREYMRNYYQEHPEIRERQRELQKERYKKNKPKSIQQSKLYNASHRDEVKQAQKLYYEKIIFTNSPFGDWLFN